MKKKIFITGVTSELMQRLVAHIDLDAYEVVGISRNPSGRAVPGVTMLQADIRNTQQFTDHLQGCYMVIHAAAETHAFKSNSYYEVNLEATKSLVDACKRENVEKFVFVSSSTAGANSGAYGYTKLLAERYIQAHLKSFVIFRLAEVFGGSKKEGIEELIDNALHKRFVLCPQDVPTKFFPIHMDDAARLMFEICFKPVLLNKITLINGATGYSFQEVIDLVKKVAGTRPKIIALQRSWMFLIKRVAQVVPFYVGVLPDQIDRLYALKEQGDAASDLLPLEDYLQRLAVGKKAHQN